MSDPFVRLTESIFARLGGDAFLRTNEPCSADVHHGVAIDTAGEYGVITSYRTVINIKYTGLNKPRTGDSIVVNNVTYKLDSLLKDDNYSSRWVVN